MSPELIGQQLLAAGEKRDPLKVALSQELVTLLSEQLYQSPMKAVEELVVNSFDADATICRLSVPEDLSPGAEKPIVVYDNGVGMDEDGLRDLWHIGHSEKREDRIEKARQRKQIGKFGIGKLATYSIARRITYLTRAKDGDILTTSLDFDVFKKDPTGAAVPVELEVARLSQAELAKIEGLSEALAAASAPAKPFSDKKTGTVVLLENYKDRAGEMNRGALRWILQTAMPLATDFKLYFSNQQIKSSIEKFDVEVSFGVHQLDKARRENLSEQTGETWKVKGKKLVSPLFPSGISGEVLITKRSLLETKSSDLQRSHGFFVRVRGRLVSIEDPLFGMKPVSHQTLNRFHADISADDLDERLTAPREGVETSSQLRTNFERLLSELFNQARSRYKDVLRKREDTEKRKHEVDRNFVNPTFVERPTADVLTGGGGGDPGQGADADSTWFYMKTPAEEELPGLLDDLYAERREGVYSYERTQLGGSGRLVRFDPSQRLFEINEEHEFARAHDEGDGALLEDVVTAEALLEVYLREEGIAPIHVGEILERRDQLLRSLALDRVYSLAAIAQELRDSVTDEHDLEIAQVTACRALGFVAKHLGESDVPDGVARFLDYPGTETVITLEAKSSKDKPTLPGIGFDALAQHYGDYGAEGCMLIAPGYPGGRRGQRAQAAKRSRTQKVSCWTIEQLADVVDAAESRQIGARQILAIVLNKFSPEEVAKAVEELLSEPSWSRRDLYRAIIAALHELDGTYPDQRRTFDLVLGVAARDPGFEGVGGDELKDAIRELAGASNRALRVSGEALILNTSVDELETRVSALLGKPGKPRRSGSMHDDT